MGDSPNFSLWKHHWQDEVDAAYLYRALSELESDPKRKTVFQQLAKVEDKHIIVWEKIFQEHKVELPAPKPSLKARIQNRLARHFGPALLLPLLMREEGGEVKKYLFLHKNSEPSSTQQAAFKLAKESLEHITALQKLANSDEEPWHQTESGDLLRNIVYGFNDGLTANFGLVAGVIGGSVGHYVVLLTGMAGMIADSLSMGSSGYLAAQSQREVFEHEIAMEKQEILLMPEAEEEELALIYQAKGIEEEQSRQIAREMMKDPQKALEEKIKEELKIGDMSGSPVKEGCITGVATAVGAFIPVAPFVFLDTAPAIGVSFLVSMLAHFGVGAARSLFTGRGIFRSGFDMFIVGFGVAAVSYYFGDIIVHWIAGGGQ